MKALGIGFAVLVLGFSPAIHAQELIPDTQTTVKARVLIITNEQTERLLGTDVETKTQTLKAEILEGSEKGKIVDLQNDYQTFKTGEVFYLLHTTNTMDGRDVYTVSEPYRLNALYFFVGLFVLCVFVFGGKQGIRGLLSLIASCTFIFYFLLPGIIHGYSPVLVAVGVASLIIILGSYVTHGFNKTTTAAVLGMVSTVTLTGILSSWAISYARLTGLANEEAVYLNFNTAGHINFAGLLLGGIIIGILGVLYDAAIGQAVAVEELHHAAPNLHATTVYRRAIRIGREHIGALVNTLAIAYVGVSLPLLLLFYSSSAGDIATTINREVFASEIIRITIGSIGIMLSVPLTTAIAVFMIVQKKPSIKA